MAVMGVEPAVKYSFALNGMQTRRKGQYNAELTLSPRLYVKPLITPITAIRRQEHKSKRAHARTYNYSLECDWLIKTTTLNVIGLLNCPITNCQTSNWPMTTLQMN